MNKCSTDLVFFLDSFYFRNWRSRASIVVFLVYKYFNRKLKTEITLFFFVVTMVKDFIKKTYIVTAFYVYFLDYFLPILQMAEEERIHQIVFFARRHPAR